MKTSMKVIIAVILVLCLVAGGFYWYSFRIGEKESVDRTVEGIVFLEDGTELECRVRFLGTRYVDHPEAEDQFTGGYAGGIWINDCKVLDSYPFHSGEETQTSVLGSDTGVFYLDPGMTVFAAKVDARSIFPDLESQTAYVVLKENTPEEYEDILEQLRAKEN